MTTKSPNIEDLWTVIPKKTLAKLKKVNSKRLKANRDIQKLKEKLEKISKTHIRNRKGYCFVNAAKFQNHSEQRIALKEKLLTLRRSFDDLRKLYAADRKLPRDAPTASMTITAKVTKRLKKYYTERNQASIKQCRSQIQEIKVLNWIIDELKERLKKVNRSALQRKLTYTEKEHLQCCQQLHKAKQEIKVLKDTRR